MNTVLITGVAGFIGSHLAEALLSQGYSVAGVDNFDAFYHKKLKEQNLNILRKFKNFKFYEGDIRNHDFISKIFTSTKPETIVNLAAKVGVRPSIDFPFEYYDVNVKGTLTLLEVMKQHNIKRLIHASSSSVYGNNSKVPFSETDPVDHPISPYAASKKASELLCYTYHHLYEMNIYCLRLFTVYGARQRPDLAIHKFTDLILKGQPVPVYGEGSTARDYTYIDDVIHGIIQAISHLKDFDILNLGVSKAITLNEMIMTIEKHLGMKANRKILPLQPGDVNITYADIRKAKEKIGYDPKWNFSDGIAKFIEWKRK